MHPAPKRREQIKTFHHETNQWAISAKSMEKTRVRTTAKDVDRG
jgi:hypothetical protein